MKYTRIFILVAAAIFFVAEVYNFAAILCGWNGLTVFSSETAALSLFVGFLAGFFAMIPFLEVKDPERAFNMLFYPFIGILLLWALAYIFGGQEEIWYGNYTMRESVYLAVHWAVGVVVTYGGAKIGLLSFAK
jgi:hypothetical protein